MPGRADARLSEAEFAARIAAWLEEIPAGSRAVLAIAGAPGSGKSTLAEKLVEGLPDGSAALLPMDGFHLDDEVLVPRGDRPRKGAPHTFDLGGFRSLLARLRDNAEDEIAVPRFDRDLEISRGGARMVPQSVRLIVAEGNYLALDRPGWRDLEPLFDRTAFIAVAEDELERRLRGRWEGYGLSPEAIREKLEENDLPNGRAVSRERRPVDYVITDG